MDLAMPALPSEVDIRADLQDVCFVPTRRHHRCPRAISAFLWKADTRQCD